MLARIVTIVGHAMVDIFVAAVIEGRQKAEEQEEPEE